MADPEFDLEPEPLATQPPSRVRRGLTVAIILLLVVSTVFLAFISGRGVVTVTPSFVLPPASAEFSLPVTSVPAGSRLAVVDAAGRLSVMDATGNAVIALGRASGGYQFPTWSPDGTHVAVIGRDGATGVIEVFDLRRDASAATPAVTVYHSPDRPPFYAYWSPDSRSLAFLTTEPDGLALRVGPADASAAATTVRTGAPLYWDWAGSDRLFVHSGGMGTGAAIGELGTDGTAVTADPIVPGSFRTPPMTSSAAFRAFVVPGDRAPQKVVVEARDGSNRHGVEVFGGAALEFGPATQTLAFIAPDAAGREVALPAGPLRMIDAASDRPRTLLAGEVVTFFWAPDARTIAALAISGAPDNQVTRAGGVTLAAARPRQPAAAAPAVGAPAAEPAALPGVGLRLIFVDVDSGTVRSQRSVQVGDVFVQQVLPFFDQYAVSHRFWSADSRSIALPLVDTDGATHIAVIASDGSAPTPVADGVAAAWSP